MSNQYPGGFITKSPVAPTTSAASGIWTIDQAMQYIKAGTWPGLPDPYFPYVSMLLPGNGTNGAQNNTFLDSSTNNFTITRNGNTTQGTFAPYGANWSNYFDGSSYLQLADSTAWDLTGDYTVEMWLYVTSTPASPTFFQIGDTSNYLLWYLASATKYLTLTGSVGITASTALVLNTWNHVALVRNGSGSNNTVMYLNGVNVGQTTNNTSFTGSASNGVRIGAEYPTGYQLNGYISNLRLVKGTAVYTSAFTPPTAPLTAISGTQLLTCQSNRFRDNSSNAFAVTVNGSPSVQVFSPFSPTASYDASTIGGSGYFDGSGDYLSVADNSALEGFGDFTIEFWLNLNSIATGTCVLTKGWSSGNYAPYLFYVNGTNLALYASSNGSTWDVSNNTTITALTTGQWYHIAVSRSGSSLRIFANGSLVTTVTNGTALMTNASALTIAADSAGASAITGYVSNVRITNTAVYTAAFTPATSPLSAVSGTALLLNFTNIGVIDNAMMNDLETVGNAQISTTQSKWGGSSIAFDGTGDRLTVPFTNDFLELGINGQNFTVEAWIYPTNTMASTGQILSKGGGTASWSTTSGAQYQWAISSSALSWSFNSSGAAITVNSGTVTLNTWQHVAVTYDGTTTRTFLNGVLQATSTSSYTAPTTRNLQYIGMTQSGGYTQEYYGYIDDLRITKGYARYTANFTVPGAAFPTR